MNKKITVVAQKNKNNYRGVRDIFEEVHLVVLAEWRFCPFHFSYPFNHTGVAYAGYRMCQPFRMWRRRVVVENNIILCIIITLKPISVICPS